MAIVLILHCLHLDIHIKYRWRVCVEHVVWTLINNIVLLYLLVLLVSNYLQIPRIAQLYLNHLVVDSSWCPVFLLFVLLLIASVRVYAVVYFEIDDGAD